LAGRSAAPGIHHQLQPIELSPTSSKEPTVDDFERFHAPLRKAVATCSERAQEYALNVVLPILGSLKGPDAMAHIAGLIAHSFDAGVNAVLTAPPELPLSPPTPEGGAPDFSDKVIDFSARRAVRDRLRQAANDQ